MNIYFRIKYNKSKVLCLYTFENYLNANIINACSFRNHDIILTNEVIIYLQPRIFSLILLSLYDPSFTKKIFNTFAYLRINFEFLFI